LAILQNCRLSSFHDRHYRIGGSQVDTNDFCHYFLSPFQKGLVETSSHQYVETSFCQYTRVSSCAKSSFELRGARNGDLSRANNTFPQGISWQNYVQNGSFWLICTRLRHNSFMPAWVELLSRSADLPHSEQVELRSESARDQEQALYPGVG